MNDETRRAINDAVARALDAKNAEIAAAIAEGLRTFADRPAGEKGAPSLQYGIVDEVFPDDGYAQVTLDGQTEPVPINMLGGLTVDERVAVLLVPPSGNLAIGMVTPTVVPATFDPQVDSYADVSAASKVSGSLLDWVLDPGTGGGGAIDLPSVGLLDLTAPTAPEVIADGYFDFDMWIAGPAIDASVRVNYFILRSGDPILAASTGMILSSTATNANYVSFSFSYPCLAGDLITVMEQNDSGGSHAFALAGSVKRLA